MSPSPPEPLSPPRASTSVAPAMAVAIVLLSTTLPATAGEYRRFEQDPARDNLVHGPGYVVGDAASLGRVESSGDGPLPAVLVAAGTFGGSVYRDFQKEHGERFTFHTVTLAGFDGTPAPPMPPAGTSYAEQTWIRGAARALASWIEAQRLVRPILIGHWIVGGDVAMRVALDRPELIGGLVLISAAPKWPLGQPAETLEQRVAVVDVGLAPLWFKTVTEDTWLDNNFLPGDYARHPVRGLRLWREAEAAPLPVRIRYSLEARAQDLAAEAARLRVPTLVVIPGFDDAFFTGPHDRDYMRRFTQDPWKDVAERPGMLWRVTIPGARVFVMDDEPEALAAAIETFLGPEGASCGVPATATTPAAAEAGSATGAAAPSSGGVPSPLERLTWVLPGPRWGLEPGGTDPADVATLAYDGGVGRGKVTLQAVPPTTLAALVPALENAFASRYPEFAKTAAGIVAVDGRDVYRLDSVFAEEGTRLQATALFTLTADGQLLGVAFRADAALMPALAADLARLLASMRWDGRRLVAVEE